MPPIIVLYRVPSGAQTGLRDRRPDKVFLMTKVCTQGRSGNLAMQTLEDLLRRYQTDHLDLCWIHGIVYDNDPELATPRAAS